MPIKNVQKRGKMGADERKVRLQYIASQFRKGKSKLSIAEDIAQKWDIKPQAAAIWIRETYKYMASGDEAFIKNLRRIQLERLEYMLQKAIEKEDWKTANSIADTINKTFALYEIKTKVELSDNVIHFKFGGTDITNQPQEADQVSENNEEDDYELDE